jgi:predicted small metal-binding protein
MKTMTCKELGGACEHQFSAASFEELVMQSKMHGMQMFQQQDPQHMQAMLKVQGLMANPEAMQAFMAEKRAQFDAKPED